MKFTRQNTYLFTLLLTLFILTVSLQAYYADKRYGERIPLAECPWCDARDAGNDDVLFIPVNASIMRLLAPSDPDFLADLMWMRISYYFGEHSLTNREYPYLFHMLDLVTDLAPNWVQPYHFGAIMLPTEAESVEEGLYLLDKGIIFHPEDWQLWFYKGYYLWRIIDDPLAAAEAIHKASVLPESPVYLARLSATLATRSGQKQLALRFLQEAMKNLNDPKQREALLKKMKELNLDE